MEKKNYLKPEYEVEQVSLKDCLLSSGINILDTTPDYNNIGYVDDVL